MSDQSVVLLTGASHGIGYAAAELLAAQNFRVFGTSRHPASAKIPEGVEPLELDVTSQPSVERCVAQVIERAGRIDVLINNAGYSHVGPVQDTSVEELRDQYETNVYGVHRLIQAVLPPMIARGNGRIVNVSSAIGRVALPYLTIYCSSKFALEGYSEGLAQELRPLGVHVVIVEPGATATEFHAHSTSPATISPHYRQAIETQRAHFAENLPKFADQVDVVARLISHAVSDPTPQLRYLAPAAKALLKQE